MTDETKDILVMTNTGTSIAPFKLRFDPITGREISMACWDGIHQRGQDDQVIETDCNRYSCQCMCHDHDPLP